MFEKIMTKMVKQLKKNGPDILTGLGIVGVVGTAVLAAMNTKEAIDVLKKKEEEKGCQLTNKERVLTAAPIYIPTVLAGASSIACICGIKALTRKSQASLISAYGVLERSYAEYRDAAGRVYGKDADTKIREEIAKNKYKADTMYFSPGDGFLPEDLNGDEMLFFDEYSNRYFESTIAKVREAEYHLNRNFMLSGECELNDYYNFLGLPKTEDGSVVGWSTFNDYYWLDFYHSKVELDDGLECYIIGSLYPPTADFRET